GRRLARLPLAGDDPGPWSLDVDGAGQEPVAPGRLDPTAHRRARQPAAVPEDPVSTERATIARHAGTVLAGQLATMAFGVTDTIVAGRYSQQALAALS